MSERPKRFTGRQLAAMLTSIAEDDSEGESENNEDDELDWELCYSDKICDDEETEQFLL